MAYNKNINTIDSLLLVLFILFFEFCFCAGGISRVRLGKGAWDPPNPPPSNGCGTRKKRFDCLFCAIKTFCGHNVLVLTKTVSKKHSSVDQQM